MALDGNLIAISVSDAPDRVRLGFPQREIDRAVVTICTALVRAGAKIIYGGNLHPEGYTFKIFRNLAGAYARHKADTPFFHLIAEPVGRATRYEDLLATLREGRGTVQTELVRGDQAIGARLGSNGIRLGPETIIDDAQLVEWYAAVPMGISQQAYTVARRIATQLADARVILGGKMGIRGNAADQYEGAMPGIAEEAIMTLEANKPLVVLGGFGGVSRDVAIALGLLDPALRVPRPEQDPGYAQAIERIASMRLNIPNALRYALERIADSDRSEQTGFALALLIEQWLSVAESS